MSYLLFPGRHLLHTRFQEDYLRRVLAARPVDTIVFAITSSNQENTRYNPVPFHVRAVGVDRFGARLRAATGAAYRIVGVPHFGHTERFARNTLREIEAETEGAVALSPENAVVLTSTPEVARLYEALGFAILPAEAGEPPGLRPEAPVDLVRRLALSGERWRDDADFRAKLSPATLTLWEDFPEVPRRVVRLSRDPLLNDDASLTDARDYATYASGMSNAEIVELKYRDVKDAIVPGRIVDEGCADGALLVPIARDFPDSDLMGIEITGEFMALCRERQRRGDFGGTHVHFHQRNLFDEIFEPASIDTTMCNSTLHEIWSYGEGRASVESYLARKWRQTRHGGRIVVRDVVGPERGEEEVWLLLDAEDGENGDVHRECADRRALAAHLGGLSTAARFRRFAQDFLADMRARGRRGPETALRWREEEAGGARYVVLGFRDAAEFFSKKDYTDNWASEMNEEFCFFDYAAWKAALGRAGFLVLEGAPGGSRAYTSAWIVENRWRGRARIFRRGEGGLEEMAWPPTNVVLVGEKR